MKRATPITEHELYCPNCGNAVEESNTFCPSCGALIKGSPAAPGAPQAASYAPAARTKSRTGYLVTLFGGVLTFLSGVAYLVLGNPVAGVLGVVFGIAVIVAARRIFSAPDMKTVGLVGVTPFFIGWIVLIASGTLLPFDLVVSLAGVLTVVGSSAMIARR